MGQSGSLRFYCKSRADVPWPTSVPCEATTFILASPDGKSRNKGGVPPYCGSLFPGGLGLVSQNCWMG